MDFPNCSLISVTAPAGVPANLVLGIVIQGDARVTVQKLTLQDGEFFFDDETFVPFQDPTELKLGLNVLGPPHTDCGVVIISANDLDKGELTQKFDLFDRLYALTYKVL